MLISSQDPATDLDGGPVKGKPRSKLLERSAAITFALSAVLAMSGWLYMFGLGLWAVANWLIS